MNAMVEYSFDNNINFSMKRDKSFNNITNNEMTPKFIAAYCDNEFKKGFTGLNEIEINARLDAIMDLLCCLFFERSIFIKMYTKYL